MGGHRMSLHYGQLMTYCQGDQILTASPRTATRPRAKVGIESTELMIHFDGVFIN